MTESTYEYLQKLAATHCCSKCPYFVNKTDSYNLVLFCEAISGEPQNINNRVKTCYGYDVGDIA